MGYSDENSLIALARLLDNKIYMSVEGLSTTLGQTNAVVDALLKRLPAYGVHLQVSDDKKFRLVQPISWLSAKNIYAYDPRLMKDHQITVVNVTESTNTDLISLASRIKIDSRLIRIAELQTHGKGRRGRRWLSGLGDSLTFSMLINLKTNKNSMSGLSLAVGVAIIKALKSIGQTHYMLKWPNDIIWRGKKVGGVLIEIITIKPGSAKLVIGIGLNVRGSGYKQSKIDIPISDLEKGGVSQSRNLLMAKLISNLSLILDQFSDSGLVGLKSEWESFHYYGGKRVVLSASNEKIVGLVQGINEDGALIVKTKGEIRLFSNGEISLRPYREQVSEQE